MATNGVQLAPYRNQPMRRTKPVVGLMAGMHVGQTIDSWSCRRDSHGRTADEVKCVNDGAVRRGGLREATGEVHVWGIHPRMRDRVPR